MKKIGLTLLSLTIALAACGEAPTAANAVDAPAAMNGLLDPSGSYEEENPGFGGSETYEEENPGLLGSGQVTAPEDGEWMTTAENPGFLGSGH